MFRSVPVIATVLATMISPVAEPAAHGDPSPALDGLPPGSVPAEQPVTTLDLTTADGERTEVAVGGFDSAGPAPLSDGGEAASIILTAPLDTSEFYVAALTWDGELPAETGILVRVRTSQTWSEWSALESDSGEMTAEPADDAVAGTEPYIAAGATGVQVQVSGNEAPDNLDLHLIPADAAEDGASVASTESAASTTAALSAVDRPAVVSRAGWGANESMMTWRPKNYRLRAAVVHHTAGQNNYSAADSPSIVRAIYHYHAVTRG